jgi:coenzyme Q-binding protein COQ10
MPSLQQIRKLPYPPQELFAMVLDVESYPQFLPWCKKARIISQDQQQIIAELVIQFKGFSERYQSKIVPKIQGEKYIIEVDAISGPFKYLKNTWQISKDDKGSIVEFFIEFKLKSILLDKLMGLFFYSAVEKMTIAFSNRARTIYLTKTQLESEDSHWLN